MNIRVTRAALLAAASSAVLMAPSAFAQEEEQTAGRTIDTIVVTAQKREQGIQDVPIAVTAFTAELLQNSGVRDIKDLTVLAPGLNVTSTTNEYSTTARIRGVGTVGDNPGLESSVGIVIDGVPRARNGVSFGDLGEIERIEEDFSLTRKIARAFITTPDDVEKALLPLLSIRSKPLLGASNFETRLRTRLKDISPDAVTSFLSETTPAEIARILGATS